MRCGITLVAAGVFSLAAGEGRAEQLIAKLKEGVVAADRGGVLAVMGVRSMRPTVTFEFGDPALAQRIGLDRYYTLELEHGRDAVAAQAGLSRMTEIFELVEREHLGSTADVLPNDTYFRSQWALNNIGQGTGCNPQGFIFSGPAGTYADVDAVQAWGRIRSAPGIDVAVLDSGVTQHVDLAQLKPGWAFDNGSTADQCNHGTHVSGIIGARANNAQGIAGVTWDADIVPVRVLTGCSGTDTNYGLGVIWAADHARVANSSLQYYTVGTFMGDAVRYAAERGLVMVAASGNWAAVVAYPARFPQVIAVGATTNTDAKAIFSNAGPQLALSAPGDRVYSLDVSGPGRLMCLSGTSMASPHVAGAAALILSARPQALPAEVRRILVSSVQDLGPVGWDADFGWGRLNLARAVRLATCYVDADFSGKVDELDHDLFRRLLDQHRPYADVNDDGQFDGLDLAAWMEMYTGGCPR
jgi:subtilisin family serine protease